MPTDKLYAYVPDAANDLTATLANAPVADFTQASYSAFLNGGNIYTTPSLLYASTGQVAAVTATIGASGVITLTPNAAFVGTVRITATVSDGAGDRHAKLPLHRQRRISDHHAGHGQPSDGVVRHVDHDQFHADHVQQCHVLPAATIDNPLFDIEQRYGLNTADITAAFNKRHESEKYLLSSNGSNPAGSGYYVLMPNGSLYAYVPDAANDLNATLALAPVADFSQAPYVAYGNVYTTPGLAL